MSENDEIRSVVDDEESMIKYLREKIIGRPAVFSRAGDLPIDDTMSPINRTNSQNSLIDVISISTTSNDITNTDRTINQVEKFSAAGGGLNLGRRPISSSSPIIIPKKPPRSNASSQSSSSYTSVADQMSLLGETSIQSEEVSNSTLPTLSSACQQLEHSAARDRISVKNKRRQPLKGKLSTLRESEDNENGLFSSKTEVISSTPEEEHSINATTRAEPKAKQPLIDLSDLDGARARLRMSTRARDRSADNILLPKNTSTNTESSTIPPPFTPIFNKPMQRSKSFKRPQEIIETKPINRPIFKAKKEENNENELSTNQPIETSSRQDENLIEQIHVHTSSPTQSMSRSSSQEHIYDNLDVFKRNKPTVHLSSNEDLSSSTTVVKTREHPVPTNRLRPVTMLIPTDKEKEKDKQTTNEFENVFNRLKKSGSIRKGRPNEETISELPPPAPVEEKPAPPAPVPPSQPEIEPIISTNKNIGTMPTPQPLNRRKTVGGVLLPATNKVAADDNKPTPSWIDIAKQKRNKFQSVSNEKSDSEEPEHEPSIQPPVTIRKQAPSIDIRSNRKSMFEQPTTQSNSPIIERDSIRALKAGNPNRINNLIQFFDK